MATSGELEELYVLRVEDAALAERIRKLLREDPDANPKDSKIELKFEGSKGGRPHSRVGKFSIGDDAYPLTLQDLPTVVEGYKTYDDVNLVKTGDVGQVLVVHEQEAAVPTSFEAIDGVTPAMRDARRCNFRKPIDADPALVRQVEEDILTIAMGGAPSGVEFIDTEEEYVVDDMGVGSWTPLIIKKAKPSGGPEAKPRTKKAKPIAPVVQASQVEDF